MTSCSFNAGVGAGDFGDGVEAVFVVAGEGGVDVHLKLDGNVGLEQAIDAAVAFNLGDDDGERDLAFELVRSAAEGCAVVVEDDAGAAAVLAVATGDDYGDHFFIGEKLDDAFHGLVALDVAGESGGVIRRHAAAAVDVL